MNISERLLVKIRDLLDEAGIDRAVVVIDDPDDNVIHHHARGSACWRVGAGALIEGRARGELVFVPAGSNEDDQ